MKALARIKCKRLHFSQNQTSWEAFVFLYVSFIVFVVFFLNVALGAFADAAFLGDVGEMLVLAVASVLFVVAILKREAEQKSNE